ncbi:MAG: DUF47 domain-containing protein [Calditrichia bacterium]
MPFFFKKIKELESEIDRYLDLELKAAFLFKQSIKFYLGGDMEEFAQRSNEIDKTESDADLLRRSIESKLYLETLIPESRGDVLGLLESADKVLNTATETLHQFLVERPKILPEVKPLFIELTDVSIAAMETMVAAIRCYFKDLTRVRDNISKVQYLESESDKISRKLKYIVFKKDIDLCEKIHIRNFAVHIENIADEAEDVCDRLAIAAIKRSL